MLRSIANIKFCSYLQCRWLNVWRVNFYFNTLSCLNYFFPEIMGGVQNGSGNSKGVGGYFSGQKMEIPGRRGEFTWNSLRGGGMDIFWNYTIYLKWMSAQLLLKIDRWLDWPSFHEVLLNKTISKSGYQYWRARKLVFSFYQLRETQACKL